MGFVYASGFNTFVPAATGQLIAYVRNPDSYAVNKYVQLIRTEKRVFVWYKVHRDDMGQRVVTDSEWVWEDGADRPRNAANSLRFDNVESQTIRRNYDFVIGWEALEQADVNLLLAHTLMARNQRMTNFSKRAVALLETVANWGGNTADANVLNGGKGKWDLAHSDPANAGGLAIKRSLDAAAEQILLATNNSVNWHEDAPRLLISPRLAQKMSQTDEIHSYIRESPDAKGQLTGRIKGQNSRWGLPDQLYGFEVCIEDASHVTERPQADGDHALMTGAPAPRRFIKSDDSAVILTRVGGIDGQLGAPNFSTLQTYYYKKEVSLETEDDNWNRLTKGAVTENQREVLAAPESGFLITDVLT